MLSLWFFMILADLALFKLWEMRWPNGYTLFLYKNVVFMAQTEYSYFSADFRLKIFLCYS